MHFQYYPFIPQDELVGYKGYLTDSVTLKTTTPPISLSQNFLDFGRILPECSCQTLTTSFTNHMDNEVQVEWEIGKLFSAYPKKLTIPGKKSALYEIKFSPEVASNLSAMILYGQIYWSDKRLDRNSGEEASINVPLPVNLRLIGN